MSSTPRHPAPHMAPKGICPTMRSQSMTGSVSGSASPSTYYGSFPPATTSTASESNDLELGSPSGVHTPVALEHGELENRLRASLLSDDGSRRTSPRRSKSRRIRREWSKSTEHVLHREHYFEETDPEEEEDDDEVESDRARLLTATASETKRRARTPSRLRDTHWGVRKMELMGTSWSRKTLMTLYAGVYLISALTSLELNTTPTVEPYFVSYLGSHSSLSTLVIVVSVAFAVGKPPFAKILDVFGRAEGIALAALLFALGYLMAACSTSIPMFLVAKALAALGAQGIQLAQQIIVADTTTLTNRGLITSTISLPWLVTTWIGPPIGAMFQSLGPTGYRTCYALFGILLPLVSGLLVLTLFAQWKRTKRLDARLLVATVVGRPEMVQVESGKVQPVEQPHVAWAGKARTVWAELDVFGLVALTAGCICLLVPFTIAQQRPAAFSDLGVWLLVVFGIAMLTVFWKYESSIAKLPLLPPRLLRDRTILCGSVLGFFHFASQYCYESFFTSFLQVARGHTPRNASYISQSYIFAASISAIVAGFGAKWSQRYKWIGILGAIVHLLGTCLMLRTRNLDSSTFELVMSQVIGGIGGGFVTIAAQIGCQGVVSHQDVGIATAIFLTLTQIGGAFGGATAGAIWSSLLPRRLRTHLPPEDSSLIPDIISSLPYAISFEPGTPTRMAIDQAYVDVQRVLNATAIALLLPGILAVCRMRNVHLEREDTQSKGNGFVVLGTATTVPVATNGNGDSGSVGDGEDELLTNSETSSLLRESV